MDGDFLGTKVDKRRSFIIYYTIHNNYWIYGCDFITTSDYDKHREWLC